MTTVLAIDSKLIERARKISGQPTNSAAVTMALQEFIARREQKELARLFRSLEWDSDFTYKSERSRN